MKKFVAIAVVTLAFTSSALAAQFKGFLMDQKCSANPKMIGNSACAKGCIKGGSPAVLVTADGKVYKISNQAMAIPHAGEHVTIKGTLKGDTITVASIK